MSITRLKVAAILTLFSALAIGQAADSPIGSDNSKVSKLLEDLHAEVPWYYREMEHQSIRQHVPSAWFGKAIQEDMATDRQRERAQVQLSAMGTNAWSAISVLLKDVADTNNFDRAVTAAEILPAIKADEYPGWPVLARQWNGQIRPAQAFRHLLSGKPRYQPQYDFAHRRFGLIGLAAVGPAAGMAIPDVVEVLKSKADHELWVPALMTLQRIGGNPAEAVPFQMKVAQDTEEWPKVRASALRVLAARVPDFPEARKVLQRALQDPMSWVRLTAAQELWKLKAPPEDVLPTFAALLQSKLASVRTAALFAISEMGSAARPIQSEVAQLTLDGNESIRQAAAIAVARITGVEPGGPANGSHPIGSDTNRTSSAAGPRR